MKSRVEDFHDPSFDPLVAQAIEFGASELGMQYLPSERVAVVPDSIDGVVQAVSYIQAV